MNKNTLLTVGAIAFAGYALWYVNKTPGKAVSTQPAQQQRDTGLSTWLGSWDAFTSEVRQGARVDAGFGLPWFTTVNTPDAPGTSFLPAGGFNFGG